jgi:uncharacterized protein YdbL (DUF1318 family)
MIADKEIAMRPWMPLKVMLISSVIAACVTINVYFPAAAAEKAADQIIDTVTSRGVAVPVQPGIPAGQSGSTPPRSGLLPDSRPAVVSRSSNQDWLTDAGERFIALLIPSAHAQNANIDVSSAEIRALTASMQQRFAQLTKFFDAGAVGLTSDGMIATRDPSAVALPDRALATRLVTEDNRDRAALYAEIAKANGHPEWEAEIRKTFARRWIERGAQPGWYYQDGSGAWQKK